MIRVASQSGAELFDEDCLEDILSDIGNVLWVGDKEVSSFPFTQTA